MAMMSTMKRIMSLAARSGLLRATARLHHDQDGGMLDYAMVFTFISVPLLALFKTLFDILSDYFAMIAFYVSWPFI